MNKWDRLEQELQARKAHNLHRTLRVIDSAQSRWVRHGGRRMLMLASNAYLDLCSDARVLERAAQALRTHGMGSGGSRLTTGTTDLHTGLEHALARFKGREAAMVFNTGFAANYGVIAALCGEGDVILSDALNHASIIDGCRQSKARVVVYAHNDMADLERKAAEHRGARGLIVSDGVFSMDGDIVNLPELVRIADTYGFWSMIDDAHATGVLGPTGRGTEEHWGMQGAVDICMGTLSKALGAEGGWIAGPAVLVDYLQNTARSYVFSTSLSPAVMAAAHAALDILAAEPERVARLQENIRWFCACLQAQGLRIASQTAIVPIPVGDEKRAADAAEQLMREGYFINAIRWPTVKKGAAILRAALMSSHTREELEGAARAIARAVSGAGG